MVVEGAHLLAGRRVALDAEQEVGGEQHRLQSEPDSLLERIAGRPRLPHQAEQRVDVGRGHRATVRAAGQVRDHLARAGLVVFARPGPADEDALVARRRGLARVEGSDDVDVVDVQDPPSVVHHVVARIVDVGDMRVGEAEVVHPGRHGNARDELPALVAEGVAPLDELLAEHLPVERRDHRHGRLALPGVLDEAGQPFLGRHACFERPVAPVALLRLNRAAGDELPAAVTVVGGAEAQFVLGVPREEVRAVQRAPHRVGQDVPGGQLVAGVVRAPAHVTGEQGRLGGQRLAEDRDAREPLRRGDVLLHQQRRHRQHVADVVEAVAGIVDGELVGRAAVDAEQAADRVVVLDPVEPPCGHAARIGRSAIAGVGQIRFDGRGQACDRVVGRPGASRGRHLPGVQSSEHPGPGVDPRVGGVGPGGECLRIDGGREPLQVEVDRAQAVSVADDAVLGEERRGLGVQRGGRRCAYCSGCLFGSRRRRRRCQGEHQASAAEPPDRLDIETHAEALPHGADHYGTHVDPCGRDV